jgi:tetratricopeptide (TPR) repeat protein
VLALLFLVGFVGFGIGGEVGGGGIIDSITGGGGGSTAEQFEDQIEDAEDRVEEDPTDQKALENLAFYRAQSGFAQLEIDEQTGQPIGLTEESRDEFEAAIDAWTKYLDVAKKPDDATAGQIIRAYQSLGDYEGAADTQEVVVKADPSFVGYRDLAYLRYLDLDLKRGDEALDQARAEADKSNQSQIKQLEKLRERVVKAKKQAEKQPDAATGEAPLVDPFGGLNPGGGGALPPTAP